MEFVHTIFFLCYVENGFSFSFSFSEWSENRVELGVVFWERVSPLLESPQR